MQISLKVMQGKSEGKEIHIPVSRFLIGRNEECHLRPKSHTISRRHCELSIEDETVWAEDLGSRNGTQINGEKISGRTKVAHGDVLRVGKLEFQVVVHQPETGGKFDVASWLDDDESTAPELADPETRQLKLDETNRSRLRQAVQAAQAAEADSDEGEAAAPQPEEDEEVSDDTTGFVLGGKEKDKKKPKPGKLPKQSGPSSADSTAAASDALKNFFKNRS